MFNFAKLLAISILISSCSSSNKELNSNHVSIENNQNHQILSSKTTSIKINNNLRKKSPKKISYIDLENKNEFEKPNYQISKYERDYPIEKKPSPFELDYKKKINKGSDKKTKNLATTIFFKNGSTNFTRKEIKKIKEIANKCKKKVCKIEIEGHSSSKTNSKNQIKSKIINLKISSKRSEKTAKLFKSFGIKNIETISFGDSKRLSKIKNNLSEKHDRRVEIFIIN